MHPEYETGLWTIAAQPYPSGYVRGMIVRRRQATAALVVAALLTSGCGSPAAPPTPELTPASSSPVDDDAAAFAAAEATYRAYVDAVNTIDLGLPETFLRPLHLTTGLARQAAQGSFDEMSAKGWEVSGSSRIASVSPADSQQAPNQVTLAVCLDVSEVTVVDGNGASVVGDRPDVQQLQVVVSRIDGEWLISEFESDSMAPAC